MWNGWGERIETNWMLPPWQAGVMELTHEEVLHVQAEVQIIIDEYVPSPEYSYAPVPPDNEYIVLKYNQRDWTKCINGDTYAVIKQYDPDVNKLGIDANGIVQEVQPEVGEE